MKADAAPGRDWADARILVLSPAPTHPQDDGDRKRVFEICRRLAAEKARITVVHYAVGRGACGGMLSSGSERAMAAAWAQYYAVAPSREIRRRPATQHYLIDEWWDPAVGTFLHWLFSVQSFDAFIVNGGWLSKAFEFAPVPVFKILDAHGEFSGVPEVLETLGSKAEFFRTTVPEQKIALGRADLVWAISDEERAQFGRMTATPLLTMPHVDSSGPIARPAPDDDGYLRVGLVGTRSDVDRINIDRFVEATGPIFRETFAPIKLVIAGAVCGRLGRTGYPFIELWPAETLEDFYRSVDCVAIPLEISAGPRIQTSEAISREMPVVSTAYAFEGYSRAGNTHGFASFGQMAKALSDLAFAPRTELDALAAASRSVQVHAATQVERALGRSATLMRKSRRMIVLAVDSRAFVPGSIFNLALFSIYDRLRHLANITVLVAAGSARDLVRNPSAVSRFHRVVVGPDIADASGLREKLATLGADVRETGDLLRMAAPTILIVDALHPAMFTGSFPETVVVARTEMIAFSEGSMAFALPGARYRRAFVSAPAQSQELAERLAASGAEPLLDTCLWPSAFGSSLADGRERERAVALLGTPRASATAIAARMAQSWKLKPVIVYGIGESMPARLDGISCIRADAYVAAILKGAVAIPQFAVDLSAGAVGLPLCREVLERLHVPTVSTSPAGSNHDMLPLLARTEGELWRVFRSFATEPYEMHERNFAAVWHDLEAAQGWTWLRRYCTLLFEVKTAEFA